LLAEAVAALARSRAKHWYHRVALARRDLERTVAAIGWLAPQASAASAMWVVAPGVAVTKAGRVDTGARVHFAAGQHARVLGSSSVEGEAGLQFVRLEGALPPPILLARTATPSSEVAAVGRTGAKFLLAPGRCRDATLTFTPGAPLPEDAWLAVMLLASGDVVALACPGSDPLPAARVLRALDRLGVAPARRPVEAPANDELGLERRTDPADYADRTGYDADFIGVRVPLPEPRGDLAGDALAYTNEAGERTVVLPYMHFSVVMSKSRRLSLFTAANVDGESLQRLPRSSTGWALDPRIADAAQFDNDLYVDNDLDRGHMVRRLDPVWGDDAEIADADTFHYTNSCPQHKDLNQKTWNDLEEYVYQNAGTHTLKLDVFTGPVFGPDDPTYRGARIPLQFWKVIAMVRPDGELSATAYILSQADMVDGLEFTFGEFRTYQIALVELEQLARLDFGKLRDFDPKKPDDGGLESARSAPTPIAGPGDLML
jgi:endonuclease G